MPLFINPSQLPHHRLNHFSTTTRNHCPLYPPSQSPTPLPSIPPNTIINSSPDTIITTYHLYLAAEAEVEACLESISLTPAGEQVTPSFEAKPLQRFIVIGSKTFRTTAVELFEIVIDDY